MIILFCLFVALSHRSQINHECKKAPHFLELLFIFTFELLILLPNFHIYFSHSISYFFIELSNTLGYQLLVI